MSRTRPLMDRFIDKLLVMPNGCWEWTASRDGTGYGRMGIARGKSQAAHRMAYELFVGPLSSALELDHLCHAADSSCPGGNDCLHRRCVNPSHLEPVTRPVHNRRHPRAQQTHCVHGHEFTPANTRRKKGSGWRQCRECDRLVHQRKRTVTAT